jgi:hypothetical protein
MNRRRRQKIAFVPGSCPANLLAVPLKLRKQTDLPFGGIVAEHPGGRPHDYIPEVPESDFGGTAGATGPKTQLGLLGAL